MRNFILSVLITCLLFAYNANAGEDPRNSAGYDKTSWSMSVEEVLSAESPRVEKLQKPENFRIGVGLLSINEIKIGASKFHAIFIFDKNQKKLIQVNLTSYEEHNPDINSMVFSQLEKLLTEKYGTPTFKQDGKTVTWKLQKTVIDLTHLYIPDIMTKLTVIYKPSQSSNAATQNL